MNITHRCSLGIGDNDFLQDQPDGCVFATDGVRSERSAVAYYMSDEQAAEIIYHRENGFSPNCVICAENARRAKQDRIERLQIEMLFCNDFNRLTEIEIDLAGLGAPVNDGPSKDREDELIDNYALGRHFLADARARGGGL